MIRKIGLQVIAVLLTIIFTGVDLMAQRRISFRRGASSATVTGKIAGRGYTEYVINGRAGQLMSIDIRSRNGMVLVNAGSASGKNFSVEMTGGDHLLSIVNQGRGATNYTLVVSIR